MFVCQYFYIKNKIFRTYPYSLLIDKYNETIMLRFEPVLINFKAFHSTGLLLCRTRCTGASPPHRQTPSSVKRSRERGWNISRYHYMQLEAMPWHLCCSSVALYSLLRVSSLSDDKSKVRQISSE